MDKVIMPEIIPPALAEAIAKNPEILRSIVDPQPNEEVIIGQNCTLDCSSNPTNVKLVFCNVTIELDEAEEGCGTGESGEQAGSCHVKIGSQKDSHWEGLSGVLHQLRLEVAVLEAKVNVIEKILKMIPRQAANRKLLARCKVDLNEATEQLAAKKRELEDRTQFVQS